MEYIALDVHKHYTWARVENDQGHKVLECKLAHRRGTIKNFAKQWSPGTPVAAETLSQSEGGSQWTHEQAALSVVWITSVRDSFLLLSTSKKRPRPGGELPR